MSQRYVINNESLYDFDVENIINCTKNYSQLQLLKYLKSNYKASYLLVAEQIKLHEKLKQKLPNWSKAGCLVTARSLEQSSSEALATYKASLVKGELLIDLSGGLGVDDVAFSKRFVQVISVDVDGELNKLVRFNFNRFLIRNISRFDVSAEDYVENSKEKADIIYLDADRRPTNNSKVFKLEDSVPNVVTLMPYLLLKSKQVMIKLSPMVDIQLLIKTFPELKQVKVVGYKNEVKEILAVLESGIHEIDIDAIEVNELGKPLNGFSNQNKGLNAESTPLPEVIKYFYEPANMLIKSGLTVLYANTIKLHLVSKNSHYMLGEYLAEGFLGRRFSIVHQSSFSKSALTNYLKSNAIKKANVSARNFVTTVEELRQTFKLQDGGEDYLFFTQDAVKNKLFFHCRKI